MKKFLFDVHNFDDGGNKDDLEDLPPPPPVYSQEDLDAAKQDSYEQGRNSGNAEALCGIEMKTSDIMAAIRDHFSILFDAEDRRSRTFEKESVQLAYTVFAQAFPALNEKFGLEEVRKAIANILETVREQPEIIIDIPPAHVDIIQRDIEGILHQFGGPRCIVRGNDSLQTGQCKLAWTNGSAIKNTTQLVEQIRAQIEHLLAEKAILTDNNNEQAEPDTPAPAATENGEA